VAGQGYEAAGRSRLGARRANKNNDRDLGIAKDLNDLLGDVECAGR
jgi:hypothetical protein